MEFNTMDIDLIPSISYLCQCIIIIFDKNQYQTFLMAKKLADESDIVIIGSTTDDLIEDRLKADKITFRYRSRILLFTDGFW